MAVKAGGQEFKAARQDGRKPCSGQRVLPGFLPTLPAPCLSPLNSCPPALPPSRLAWINVASAPVERDEQRIELLPQLEQPRAIDGYHLARRRAARADGRGRRLGQHAIDKLLRVDDASAQSVVGRRLCRRAR